MAKRNLLQIKSGATRGGVKMSCYNEDKFEPTREQARESEFNSRMEQAKTESAQAAKKSLRKKVTVSCFHCNNEYEIIIDGLATHFDVTNYCCPDCRMDYQVTDDPARVQGFDVYGEKYLRRLGWGI